MFEILLQAYQEKIYSLKLKDIKTLWTGYKVPFLCLMAYILVVIVGWLAWLKTNAPWILLGLIVFIVWWAIAMNRLTQFTYIERYKKKKEAISALSEILEEIGVYKEEKVDILLDACSIWLNGGDKFDAFTGPIVKYFTTICFPIIMFFIGLAANNLSDTTSEVVAQYAGIAMAFSIVIGIFLWEAYTLLKPFINRKYDAAKSLQMLLMDLKMQRFCKR